MYGVEGGLSKEELETQARTEWIQRGFPEEEYTYAGMQTVWKQEQNVKVAEENAENRLAEKMATIQRSKDRAVLPSKQKVTEVISETWSSVKVSSKATAARLVRSMELPFMRRARLQREHLDRVLQQHTTADKLHLKKEEARRVRRLERIHELDMDKKNRDAVVGGAPFRAHLQALEDEAANNKKALEDQARKDKRQAYIDGIHAQQAARRKAVADQKAAAKRRARAKAERKFANEAKKTKDENVNRRERLRKDRVGKAAKKKMDFQQEQEDYKINLVKEEMSFPQVSSSSAGGVFGTPNEIGSYHRDGRKEGLDELTITGGSILNAGAPTGTAFEERQALLYELQGKQGKLQDEYDELRRSIATSVRWCCFFFSFSFFFCINFFEFHFRARCYFFFVRKWNSLQDEP